VEERAEYLSYVLRLWQSGELWCASLTDPVTGERFGFSSLEALFEFLREQTLGQAQRTDSKPGLDANG